MRRFVCSSEEERHAEAAGQDDESLEANDKPKCWRLTLQLILRTVACAATIYDTAESFNVLESLRKAKFQASGGVTIEMLFLHTLITLNNNHKTGLLCIFGTRRYLFTSVVQRFEYSFYFLNASFKLFMVG